MTQRPCPERWGSCGRIGLRMSTPFAHCGQEVVNGLFFRPEVAKQILRIPRKDQTLRDNQFLGSRKALTRISLSELVHWILHGSSSVYSVALALLALAVSSRGGEHHGPRSNSLVPELPSVPEIHPNHLTSSVDIWRQLS